jgi:hypothetical protein
MKEIQAGSSFPIDADSRTLITTVYRGSFERRLGKAGVWAAEGGTVLNAARQVGVIASAIAALQFQPEPRTVKQWMVDKAAQLVEEYCAVGVEEGQWCKRDRRDP